MMGAAKTYSIIFERYEASLALCSWDTFRNMIDNPLNPVTFYTVFV